MSKSEKGKLLLDELSPGAYEDLESQLKPISPSLFATVVENCYGDVMQNGAEKTSTKQMVVIAILAAQGGNIVQLDKHIEAALNSGISKEQLVEIANVVAVYSGVQNGLNLIKKISSFSN